MKVLKIGYAYYLPLNNDKAFTKCIIEMTMIFFDLMEDFTKGKIFKIQTDRRIKRKVKPKKKKRRKKRKAKTTQSLGETT